MRVRAFLLGVVYCLSVVGIARAGDIPADVKRNFESQIGHWTAVTTWMGTSFDSISTTKWGLGKKSLVIHWTMFTEDGPIVATEVSCWDSAENAIVVRGTTLRGDYWRVAYTKFNKNKWSGHGTGLFDGKPWDSPTMIEWSKNGWRYEDVSDGAPFISVGKRVMIDATVSAREHMKELKDFVGTWKFTRPAPEYLANSPKLREFVGKPLTRNVGFRWSSDRSTLVARHTVDFDGKFTIKGTELYGWDSSLGAIRVYMFTSAGGNWEGIMRKSGDTWIKDYHGVNLEGDEGSGQLIFKFDGPDKMTATEKHITYAGKPVTGSTAHGERESK